MKVIRPHLKEIVRVTCSCGCEDYIQFDRFLENYSLQEEELYCITLESENNWPLRLKLKELKRALSKDRNYFRSNMMSVAQAEELYKILVEDIENFNEPTADFILENIKNSYGVREEDVDDETLIVGRFAEDLMWIGMDGFRKDGKFYPDSIVIGWNIHESYTRRDVLRGLRHFLRREGKKYYITYYDGILEKEDISVILSSITYIIDNFYKESQIKGVVRL